MQSYTDVCQCVLMHRISSMRIKRNMGYLAVTPVTMYLCTDVYRRAHCLTDIFGFLMLMASNSLGAWPMFWGSLSAVVSDGVLPICILKYSVRLSFFSSLGKRLHFSLSSRRSLIWSSVFSLILVSTSGLLWVLKPSLRFSRFLQA